MQELIGSIVSCFSVRLLIFRFAHLVPVLDAACFLTANGFMNVDLSNSTSVNADSIREVLLKKNLGRLLKRNYTHVIVEHKRREREKGARENLKS